MARRGLLAGGCVTKLLPIVFQCSPHYRSKYYRNYSIYFDHVSRSHYAMRVDGILWGITCHDVCAIRLLYPCITTCKQIVSDVRLLYSRAQLIQATYSRLFSTKLLLSAYSRHRGWNRDNFEWILSGFRGFVAFRFFGFGHWGFTVWFQGFKGQCNNPRELQGGAIEKVTVRT